MAQPPEEQRKRANARAYVKAYINRGNIQREPCLDCGFARAEIHHLSYDDPLAIIWLCRACHRRRHQSGQPVRPSDVRVPVHAKKPAVPEFQPGRDPDYGKTKAERERRG